MTPSADYEERVNRAIDHIVTHLNQRLTLHELASVACFSPFHFHRVFKLMTGETLKQFVIRVRLERALHRMAHGPRASLTRIALDHGFASSSDFSRAFKKKYGLPPSAFDVDAFRRERRADLDAAARGARERRVSAPDPTEYAEPFQVRIVELPARHVAYVRVTTPYEGTGVVDAANDLLQWAEARGWADGQWLGYQWDDPEIVPLEKCRYDVAVEVPAAFSPDGQVGHLQFDAMRVAEVVMDGSLELEMRALDWLWRVWLPSSGFVPDAQPGFEAWHGRPFADGTERFRLRLQIPVVDARTV